MARAQENSHDARDRSSSLYHWHMHSQRPYCSRPARPKSVHLEATALEPRQRHQFTLPVLTPTVLVWPLPASTLAAAAASKRSAVLLKKCSLHALVSWRKLQQKCGLTCPGAERACSRQRWLPSLSHTTQAATMAARLVRKRASSAANAAWPSGPGHACSIRLHSVALKNIYARESSQLERRAASRSLGQSHGPLGSSSIATSGHALVSVGSSP
mmetsp:Transcript_13222/g.26573  ORF Transcript_13222/g.26573 Transcript_13222/m.26573 type:complete len:214 (-) Transcript_13222:29-670(-)